MKNILLKSTDIHFVGIGGSGMSALASVLHERGKNISGSDQYETGITAALQKSGIPVVIGHNASALPAATQLLIYSGAVKNRNSERKRATELGIPQISYAQALGELTSSLDTIAVCGTHGKTTVTAMLSSALIAAGKDPSVIVGSHIRELENRNYRLGEGDWLIVEACEYCRNFLNYKPSAIIVNNIEIDHLDYYKDEFDYYSAFVEFALLLADNGILVLNTDDLNCRKLSQEISEKRPDVKIVEFGVTEHADFVLKGSTVMVKGVPAAKINLKIPGFHNKLNALGALAMASSLGIRIDTALEAINNYGGAKRRFEHVGNRERTLIFDDYAHHPTEIKATLRAARERFGPDKKILCIFQPHQYSRTLKLLNKFSTAFNDADCVIISDIYRTRDTLKDVKSVSSAKLADVIRKHNPNVIYGGNLENTLKEALSIISGYDVAFTMGAGNINNIASDLTTL